MKIFITMPDHELEQPNPIQGKLVPFNPDFLASEQRVRDRKPANWVSDNDYSAACERLRKEFVTA